MKFKFINILLLIVTKERGSAQPKRKNPERVDEFGVKRSACSPQDSEPSTESMMEFYKEVVETNPFVSPEYKKPEGDDPPMNAGCPPGLPQDFTEMISLAYQEVWLIVTWAKKVPGKSWI